MASSIYDEVIADAKKLREVAEQNAKNAIIDAVAPKIKQYIEKQLIGDMNESSDVDDDEDVLHDIDETQTESVEDEFVLSKRPDEES